MGILCIGQSAYDITFPLEEALQANRKYRITSHQSCGGGPAFNAACLCTQWGAETQLLSKIGTDFYGQALRSILQQLGVGCDHLVVDAQVQTPYSFIAYNRQTAERTIFNFPSPPDSVSPVIPTQSVDVILSDGHEPDWTLQALRDNPDAVSVVDAGTLRESTYAVCQKVDYLVCSEDFARQFTHQDITLEDREADEAVFRQIESINQKYAVITLGERGLLYRDPAGRLTHLPSYPVQALDTSGAGDIFHGAFTYGLFCGLSLLDNLKQSSMAAAISVQRLGSQASIPTRAEVEDQLSRVQS